MDIDDQAFLDQIEQNIRGRENEQDVARREAEQRAAEMERIRKASANLPVPGAGKAGAKEAERKKNPLEDDPRYKEYFERLKRQKGEGTSAPVSTMPRSAQTAPAKAAESQVVGPGAIVRFDDGSIGIYKDAVSGRDYALFYFLHPEGQFEPQGVFLQSYQAKVIGNLPENYFAELREKNTWERDLIVFHLSKYEHVNFLNKLAKHEERKPRNTTPPKQQAVSSPQAPEPKPAPSTPAAEEQPVEAKPEAQQSASSPAPAPAREATPTGTSALVKGRQFQIVFGGKKWEAVYWSKDENGDIVAHSTHGDWSLMRLDLERFKDSLQLGDIVDSDTLNAIAESAAKAK